jgi:Fe-S-cluster containining protein
MKEVQDPAAPEVPVASVPTDRADVEFGLRYVHLVTEGLKREVRNGNTSLYALLDVLIAKGIVSYKEMDEARAATEPVIQKAMAAIPPIRLAANIDKYAEGVAVTVPCAGKVHACKAACCHMVFSLSPQDLQEGGIRWDLYMPYQIARRPDGACVHLGDDMRCTIHDRRPAVCRAFDCRKDDRIWEDYERTVPGTHRPDPETPKT